MRSSPSPVGGDRGCPLPWPAPHPRFAAPGRPDADERGPVPVGTPDHPDSGGHLRPRLSAADIAAAGALEQVIAPDVGSIFQEKREKPGPIARVSMRNMDESDGHILKTLVGRLLFSTTLALVALVPVACAYGIRLATPTPTPTPTPIPTIWADEALEELFWMSVDLVGENSQMPEINRTLSFNVARETVRLFLFTILSGNVEHLEARGISPFETPPYCIDLTSASMHLVELSQASSPSDAAPHVDNAAGALARLELDISRIKKVGRPDKQLCDKFEAEKRDAMGWPPSQEP